MENKGRINGQRNQKEISTVMKKTYQFQFSPNGERNFVNLSKTLQSRVLKKLEYFERIENPLVFAKKLEGLNDLYRFRVGDYRIIVTPEEKNILTILLILKIAHRKEVYNG